MLLEPEGQNIPDASETAGEEPEIVAMPASSNEPSKSPYTEWMHPSQVINYYFPVEVEVVGILSDSEMKQMAQFLYNDMTAAIGSDQVLV